MNNWSGDCMLQQMDSCLGQFTLETRRSRLNQPRGFCLATDKIEHVYAIGGHEQGSTYYESIGSSRVDRYDISKDQWVIMPNLNQARNWAGACLLKDTIYVVGGLKRRQGELNSCINSIEKLILTNDVNVVQTW